MSTCTSPKAVQDIGMQIFTEHVRAGVGFFQASSAAVKALNNQGHPITRLEFDVIARTRYAEAIPNNDYQTYVDKESGKLVVEFNKAIGLTGRWTTQGKRIKAKDVGPDAHESLRRIADATQSPHNTEAYDALKQHEKIIFDLYQEGKTLGNRGMLKEAIEYVTDIRTKGKTELEERIEARKAKVKEKLDRVASALPRIGLKYQKILKEAIDILSESDNNDIEMLKLNAANAGLKIPADLTTNEEIAGFVIDRLQKMNKHWASGKWFQKIFELTGNFGATVWDDNSYTLGRLDKRGAASVDEGILETDIDDDIRQSKNRVLKDKQENIVILGKMAQESYGKAFGFKTPDFENNKIFGVKTGKINNKAAIAEQMYYTQLLSHAAISSALEIKTGLRHKAGPNVGREIILTKGEIQQLYIDVLDPNVEPNMVAAGITREELEVLAATKLEVHEREFAMAVARDFYTQMWEKENKVYREIYHTNMPRIENYGGQVSYEGSVEYKSTLTPDMVTNRQQTSVALYNAVERVKSDKPLDLKRNIFANAINRMETSAKFVGAAQSYNTLAEVLGDRDIIDQMGGGKNHSQIHLYNFGQNVRNSLDAQFGLDRKVGSLPKALSFIKGAFTHTSLALKPKLMLNQAASATTWMIEDDFWDGLAFARKGNLHPDFNNLSKMMYDATPAAIERYAKEGGLIALDANLKEAAHMSKILLESKNKLEKSYDAMQKINMWFTMKGDAIGIMAAGKYYFLGKYEKALNAGKTHEEAVQIGIEAFSKKFEKTQQSYNAIDRALIQQNEWGGMFTMFMTTPFQYGRHSLDAIRQISRGKEGKGSLAYNIKRFMMFHVASSMMYHFVMVGIPALLMGEYDEDEFWGMMQAGLLGPYFAAPFAVGTMLANIINFMNDEPFFTDVGSTPAFLALNKMNANLLQIAKLKGKSGKLSKAEQQRLDRLYMNTPMEFISLFGIATRSYGLHMNKDGDFEIESMLDPNGGMETILRIAGYSEYAIAKAKGDHKKKRKKLKIKKSKRSVQ